MPNHCSNWLDVLGDRDSIAEFKKLVTTPSVHDREKLENDSEIISIYQRAYPCPKELYESDKWYAWCNTHWGTKWGDYDTVINGESDTHLEFAFTTAWGPGVDGIINISEKFPNLVFITAYEEGGMCFVGAFGVQNGNILSDVEGKYPDLDDSETDSDGYDLDNHFEKVVEEVDRCKRMVVEGLSDETRSLFSVRN